MTDPTLVLGWLVLAHLVADFVFQTSGMVREKNAPGRRQWRGLLRHGLVVAVPLVPAVGVWGGRGAAFLAVATIAHVVIDRWKVRATRHAEAEALADARRRHEPAEADEGLGPAWTPKPGALFIADQAAHLVVLVVAWLVLLAAQPPLPAYVEAFDSVFRGYDPAAIHRVAVLGVVLASLLIVNVRAADLFVSTLVSPRQSVSRPPVDADRTASRADAPRAWRLRFGPIEATAEPVGERGSESRTAVQWHASPARIGATIGVVERLLIVAFVLTGSTAAIGFVVAAKTLARFRQLDDRDFAEYYLLGTLASVSVALASGLVAAAAIATLGLAS
jgi:hypothetical protein